MNHNALKPYAHLVGVVPDVIIAELAGCRHQAIANMRARNGIATAPNASDCLKAILRGELELRSLDAQETACEAAGGDYAPSGDSLGAEDTFYL
jgi:hypothetical protein